MNAIELDFDNNSPNVFVLFLDERGKLYTNQCGGYGCNHPEARGFLEYIPSEVISDSIGSRGYLGNRLMDYFCGPKWNGWCSNGIDDETADWLDRQLAEYHLKTNRMCMNDSYEAWIHVLNDKGMNGILVWGNSD